MLDRTEDHVQQRSCRVELKDPENRRGILRPLVFRDADDGFLQKA